MALPQGRLRVSIAPTGSPSNLDLVEADWIEITQYVRVKDGITISGGRRDEGAVVDPTNLELILDNRDGRFSARNPLGAYFPDLARNTPIRVQWDTDGLGNWIGLFTGFVSEWPASWDRSAANATAPIEGQGFLRRLQQRRGQLQSPLRREFGSPERVASGIKAYWPCEDGRDADVIGSAIEGVRPMEITGSPDLAAFADYDASAPLPQMRDARFVGLVNWYSPTGENIVRAIVHFPENGTADNQIMGVGVLGGSTWWWGVEYRAVNGGSLYVRALDQDRNLLVDQGASFKVDGLTVSISLELVETAGGDVDWKLFVYYPSRSEGLSTSGTLTGHTVGVVRSVSMAWDRDHPDVALGHVVVGDAINVFSGTDGALTAWRNERAGDRIIRLCQEEGVPVTVDGAAADEVRMGSQQRERFMRLLRQCESVDGGILYEPHDDTIRLDYRNHAVLSNQSPPILELAQAAGELAHPPEPTDDDQQITNDITLERTGGSSVHVVDTASVEREGRYEDSAEVNVADDETLANVAGWRLHLGTVDEMRWPALSTNLARNDHLIPTWLGMSPGDRVHVDHSIEQLPGVDIDLMMLGWSERIDKYNWTLELNAAPYSPWRVVELDDSTFGRLDTDGSVLVDAVGEADTEMLVSTTGDGSPVWTTDSTNWPVALTVGGEQVSATSIESAVADTFTRTVSNGWGVADTGQTWSTTGGASSDYSVTGSAGRVSLDSIEIRRFTSIGPTIADVEMAGTCMLPVAAQGGSIDISALLRYQDAGNFYMFQMLHQTDESIQLRITKRIGTGFTGLVISGGVTTHIPGTPTHFRVRAFGTSLSAKIWTDGTLEPPAWQIAATDSDLADGAVGTHTNLTSAVSNTLPVEVDYDDIRIVTPQTFTVTRAINDVSKSHAAGSSISLAYPMALAL